MFKVGQRVVCLRSGGTYYLTLGQTYTVRALDYCCEQTIDVGMSCPASRCPHCGHIASGSWYLASRFAPIEEISETTYEDILKPMEAV